MIQQFLFLLLSILVLFYNLLHGIFSNETVNIPIEFQKTLISCSYILISIYLPWYFLKVFYFNTIKFFAYWGGILFLLIPYALLYIVTIYITKLEQISAYQNAIPIIYGCSMIYFYITSLYKEYMNLMLLFSKIEVITIFASLIIWSLLPIMMVLGISNLLENSIVNVCFFLLMILLLKKNASISKRKYEELLLLISAQKECNFIEKYNLTIRQKEIVDYLIKGFTYKEIGEALFISDRTVGKHISNIYAKTGVNEKIELFEKLNLITITE